jgi:hypothetical protein
MVSGTWWHDAVVWRPSAISVLKHERGSPVQPIEFDCAIPCNNRSGRAKWRDKITSVSFWLH